MMHGGADVPAEVVYKLGIELYGKDDWMEALKAVIAHPSSSEAYM